MSQSDSSTSQRSESDFDPSEDEREDERDEQVSNDRAAADEEGQPEPSFLGSEGSEGDEAAHEGPLEAEPASQFEASVLRLDQEETLPGTEVEEQAEPPRLLDAWHAEFGDSASEALLRRELREHGDLQELVAEVVIGPDDRVRITATSRFPWRAIASLLITAADGSRWIGTGWFIGKRTLITAGHVVFIHARGGWVRRIEVIPGRDGTQRPFGSCVSTAFRSVVGWTRDRDRNFDYGAIILPSNCPLGERVGGFGFVNLGDSALRNLTVNLAGYPGDQPPGTQWWHARRLTAVNSRTLIYNIDTAGGQSGAPVWRLRNGQRHAVGIHTNGSLSGNSATRVNRPVFENLTHWKTEGGG